MALQDELVAKVHEFATDSWGDIPNATVVPSPEDLTLGNTGKHLDACVLYADLHRSTEMVDSLVDMLAAEYYKAFLYCSAKVIRSHNGVITAYDGDRIMAVYIGEDQADRAVKTALQIHSSVIHIINATFQGVYGAKHRPLVHTVGIDCGQVLVSKTGVRVDSDLVWVGPAANYAAKLNSFDGLDQIYSTRITKQVFDNLTRSCLYDNGGEIMWMGPYGNLKNRVHYRSRYFWRLP